MLMDNCIFNTGNILALNELTKKAGLNSRDELIEALKIKHQNNHSNEPSNTYNGQDGTADRNELKITVKVFVPSSDEKVFKDALDQVYKILETDTVESLVIAYDKKENADDILPALQRLWVVLEGNVKEGKLKSIGVSDVETEKFIQLFNWANVKPNIIQINLSTCCVVPPALQEFAKENDIQLLTHSDPCHILPEEDLRQFFGPEAKLNWVARYQIHLRCRGVLTSKGYLVNFRESTYNNQHD